MPSVNITTTPSKAFEIPQGAWGYRVNNVSDETIYTLENAAVTTSTGIPLAAGAERTVCFAEKAQNAMSLQAVHGGSGNKALRYEILTVQVQAITRTAAAGASFATITGAPTDNAALAAALAAKLDKAGGIITGNGAASTPALTLNGTVFTGGSTTTTKPLLLLEPSGTTSNNWSTSGTMLGVNAPSGFTGNVIHGQVNGSDVIRVSPTGYLTLGKSGVSNTQGILFYGLDRSGAIGLSIFGGGLASLGGWDVQANNARLRFIDATGTTRYGYMYGVADGQLALIANSGGMKFSIAGVVDETNYERLSFITTAGAYQIKPEAAGTGTLRELHISGLPTSNPGPGILWNNAGTPAIGT